MSKPRSLPFIHFSRLLSSSGQDLCSQRKHANLSSPCCPSHHGNHSQHVFIQKAPGSQHVQTSRTENSTVCWRMKFLACPVALKITMVWLWRCVYLQSFVPTRVQKYRLTHTPDFTSFLPCSRKNSQKTGHAWLCPSENNSITLPLTSWFWQSGLIKRDTSKAIKKKPRVKLLWMIKSHLLTIPSVLPHFSPEHSCNCAMTPFIIYNCLIFFWDRALFKSHSGHTSTKGQLKLPCNPVCVKCHYVTSPKTST